MYKYVDFNFNSILLNITIPPGPEATPTTIEGGIIMKIISTNQENKGKERSNNKYYKLHIILFNTEIQVQVDRRITLAQLKEKLVPLIGVPPTGFIVYRISGHKVKRLSMPLKDTGIYSGSEVVVLFDSLLLSMYL